MLKYRVISESKKHGFNFPFILIYPDNYTGTAKIFVEGNNSTDYELPGQQSYNAQMEFAIKYAKQITSKVDSQHFSMPLLLQNLNQPVIIPIIERCDNKHSGEFYTQMLGRNVVTSKKHDQFYNLSGQVVNMVKFVQQTLRNEGVEVEEKAGLVGMSASGVFAARMQFLEPETFNTCLSVCSNAVQPLPMSEYNGVKLPYPLGTADYKEITGKNFNMVEYKKAKQLFIVGKDEGEQYNIVKNPRLHDKEIAKTYISAYGDVTLQDRQNEISDVLSGFENIHCAVLDGGHTLNGKGNYIMSAISSVRDNSISDKNK